MQIYLDSVDLVQIEKYAALGILDGVTSNPGLIQKAKIYSLKELRERIIAVCKIVKGPVSVEVVGNSSQEMIEEGMEFVSWSTNIVVKLPCNEEGLKALSFFKKQDINTNLTLIFTPLQALLCAKLGATMVSPFVGRLEDAGQNNGLSLIGQTKQILSSFGYSTFVLAASIRHTEHMLGAALNKADIATIPPALLEKILENPLTKLGLEEFEKARQSQTSSNQNYVE